MSFFINLFPEFWLLMKDNFLRKTSEWVLANILWFFLFYIEFLCLRLKKKLIVFPNSWIYKDNFFVWNHVDLSWSIFRSCSFLLISKIWNDYSRVIYVVSSALQEAWETSVTYSSWISLIAVGHHLKNKPQY